MKNIFILILVMSSQFISAQYLNGNVFEFDIAEDNILEIYYKDFNICEIDLENKKIVNDYYWFENGIIYELDIDYEQVIGKYSKNEITVYDESYKLEKPVFSKMKLKKMNDSKFEIRVSCNSNSVHIEDEHAKTSDVIKLWLIMHGADRIIQREKNTNLILNSIQTN